MSHQSPVADPEPERIQAVYNLGLQRKEAFFQSSNIQDLNEAIIHLSKAVSLRSATLADATTSFDDARWTWLMNLGAALRTRYNRLGRMEDLTNVVIQLEEAVSICPIEEFRRPHLMNNLGRSLRSVYERTGNVLALNRAIALFRGALDRRSSAQPERVTSLQDLANALNALYKHGGRRADLDEAIQHHREALDLRPANHPELWMVQSNLGNALATRFLVSGDVQELDEAVSMQRAAVDGCPAEHRDRSNPVVNLASSLHKRFLFQAHVDDLNEAVAYNRDALRLRPIGHLGRSWPLDNLANTLSSRYNLSGDIRDLDEAIQCHREALALRLKGPARALTLNNLGLSLGKRYLETRNINDLDESVRMHRDALELRPLGHPDHWMSLSHLGSTLEYYVDSDGMPARIDEALECHRQALEQCPDSFVVRAVVLGNLAGAALERYRKYKETKDLDDAIEYHEELLTRYNTGHPHRAIALYNVAKTRETRFHIGHDKWELGEVIRRGEESQKLFPPEHPHQCKVLLTLARAYLHEDPQVHDSFLLFEEAARLSTGAIQDRLLAAIEWATVARRMKHASVIRAYTLALELLDRRLLSQPTAEMQHRLLIQLPRTLASDACSAAIALGQFDTAVELLEQGRCLLWARMTRYRHPLEELRAKSPNLAHEFESASKEFEKLATPSAHTEFDNTAFDHQLERMHKVSDRWDNVVGQIRQVEGFNNFLRAVPFAELRRAAVNGPIIIVNISNYRSDAIIISSVQPPLVVGLPNAIPDVLVAMSSELSESLEQLHSDEIIDHLHLAQYYRKQIKKSLQSLWNSVVQPIAEELYKMISPGTTGRLPRVWWYPTGVLCRLPLHAAGPSSTKNSKKSFCDHFISSYITTFRSMLEARSRPNGDHPKQGTASPNLLVIGVPGEDGEDDFLNNVEKEISLIRAQTEKSLLSSSIQVLVGPHATPEDVLSRLREYSWVHFMCHGHQHASPFESSLQLYNNQHLSLIDLMQAHIPDAQLAYLSACNTATGDFANTPDEFIHLAAAMQFCGFRSVIGTLWPMRDQDGPIATQRFYAHMFRRAGTSDFTESAEALHEAVASLRQQDAPVDSWINFVHFGL